ncbi:MAG: DUF4292 domain-containing protein [Bacteroidota bacterium]
MKNILLLAILLLTIATACDPARRAQKTKLKNKSEKFLMKRLLNTQVSADWLGSKAKVVYKDEYMRESFTAYIRMKKDSAIWMSFRKFSFEGARALITPDSIFVIDRLNNQYLAKPFSYAQQEFRLPVGFQGLQAMLLGNPVFFASQSEASVDEDRYLLLQKTDQLNAKYWLDDVKFHLSEFFVDDFRNKRKLTYKASDYQSLPDKQKFSYFRRFNLNSSDLGNMQVDVDFSKVEIDVPQKMSFSVPSRYERVD